MNKKFKSLLMVGFAAIGTFSTLLGNVAQAATPYANATVQGALAPGIYGRIEIGNAPPPPLVYVQPVIIQQSPAYVEQSPLYLHVPPGHAKKWRKHCARYNACNRPVYFVKVRGDDDYERRQYKHRAQRHDKNHRDWDDDDHGHGKGKGHNKGKHSRGDRD